MPHPQPVIRARGIRKSFPLGRNESVEILHGIDLDIAAGEFVAIMGASGSGKSTLLYALSGIDRPTSGEVTIDGVAVGDLSPTQLEAFRLSRIGFVFQQPHLIDGLTLRDNALLPASWAGRRRRAAVLADTERRLERLGIAHVADSDASVASGGERQRAGIARALVNDPAVLFADEPTGALDSASTEAVLRILEDLNRDGLTIVMVTHDPQVAARAHRVIRVVDGSVSGSVTSGAAVSRNLLQQVS